MVAYLAASQEMVTLAAISRAFCIGGKSMNIKAIETRYNGYRFRSRIEARWAVFFDALGIKYEYEREGFDMGDAGWYLPDFWLPELGLWTEIKGSSPNDEERRKARALATKGYTNVLILSGGVGIKPGQIFDDGTLYGFEPEYDGSLFIGDFDAAPLGDFWEWVLSTSFDDNWSHNLYDFIKLRYAEHPEWFSSPPPENNGSMKSMHDLVLRDQEYFLASHGKDHPKWKNGLGIPKGIVWEENHRGAVRLGEKSCSGCVSTRLLRAYAAARSARFEHGQGGAP